MNKYTTKTLVFLFTILLLSACNKKKQADSESNVIAEYKIEYAKGFRVVKLPDYTKVDVCDPWDSTRLLQTYILIDKNKQIPSNLPKGTIVRIPLSNVVAYSTIHCTTLNELGALDIIKAVCSPEYINLSAIKEGISAGKILDVGMSISPDVEKILDLSPEVIFAEPVTGQTYGNITKTKIPIIETPDYMETNPLGRAEWIRFYSLFIGKEQLADSLFANTVANYNHIKDITAKATSRPTILIDLRYMGKWNMAGGKSFMSNLIADAGGAYKWADNNSTTFLPLSFESVLDKAEDADIWLIKNFTPKDMTYQSLEKEYKPYSYFKAFKERNIWECNTSYVTYYEDLPIHPDWILKDLGAIFHPDLFKDYQTRYYKKMK